MMRGPFAVGPALAALHAVAVASAREGGEAPSSRDFPVVALILDLEKMVEVQESLGWTIDRYEYDALMPPALWSVCSATEATRVAALEELAQRIRALGGPVEEGVREERR